MREATQASDPVTYRSQSQLGHVSEHAASTVHREHVRAALNMSQEAVTWIYQGIPLLRINTHSLVTEALLRRTSLMSVVLGLRRGVSVTIAADIEYSTLKLHL